MNMDGAETGADGWSIPRDLLIVEAVDEEMRVIVGDQLLWADPTLLVRLLQAVSDATWCCVTAQVSRQESASRTCVVICTRARSEWKEPELVIDAMRRLEQLAQELAEASPL